MTDSLEYLPDALSSFLEQCLSIVQRNVTLYTEVDGVRGPDSAYLDLFCLDQCNDQGTCVNGNISTMRRSIGWDLKVRLCAGGRRFEPQLWQ
jgi:hypothetical protein